MSVKNTEKVKSHNWDVTAVMNDSKKKKSNFFNKKNNETEEQKGSFLLPIEVGKLYE